MMNDYIPWTGKIEGIFSRLVELEESFETIADRFAAFDGTVILLSGGDLDCARYHILAARPWLQFRGYGQRIHITTREKSTYFEGDPFDTLRAISDAFRIEENDLPQPMAAGLFGYLGFHGTMDLNIAIRTAVVHNDKILFSVGGGIVFDLDPADEYEETLHKGRTLMTVFKETSDYKSLKNYAWVNGVIKPLEETTVGVATPGFQYGYGIFETIRSVKGHSPLLADHLARFNRTWAHLMPGMPPDLSWDTIIDQVLSRNGLFQTTAAVKIIAACGDRENPPWNHTLMGAVPVLRSPASVTKAWHRCCAFR